MEVEAKLAPQVPSYDADTRGHVIQLYQDEAQFLNELSRFIGTALLSGGSALVVATQSHREKLAAQLKERGLDLAFAGRGGGTWRWMQRKLSRSSWWTGGLTLPVSASSSAD